MPARLANDKRQMSPHLWLSEFRQPERHGQPEMAYPEHLIRPCLMPLCWDVLEPIRAQAGRRPMTIINGWRTVEYNKVIYEAKGQKPTDSQHSYGKAADFKIQGVPAGFLHNMINEMLKRGDLPLVGGLGEYDGFVHVDIRTRPADGHVARWTGSRKEEET